MNYEEARHRAETLLQDVSQRTRSLLNEGSEGVMGAVRTAWDEKVPTASDVRRHVGEVVARVHATSVAQAVQAHAGREAREAYRAQVSRRADEVSRRAQEALGRVRFDGVSEHVKTFNKKITALAKKITTNGTT
ncbi:MAG TPA: hypothetical protein VFH51_20360 [Myxococcota bacterium]|nr:hypothetical protein [Myxococcota bacterium]